MSEYLTMLTLTGITALLVVARLAVVVLPIALFFYLNKKLKKRRV